MSFEGSFCPRCGQEAATGRLHLGGLLRELISHLTNLDGKVPRTFLGLLRAPGEVCRDYVEGRRVNYVAPLRYCLTIIAAKALIILLVGADPGETETSQFIDRFMTRHLDLIYFDVLPLFTLILRALFRKSGYSYAEVGAFVLYVMGQFLLLWLLLTPLTPLLGAWAFPLRMLIQLGILSWAAAPFFQISPGVAIFKSLLATVAYFLILTLVATILIHPQLP